MSRSILISQRWELDFHQKIKELAKDTQRSMTELTLEGLNLLELLAKETQYFELKPGQRVQRMIEIYSKTDQIMQETSKAPGLIKKRIIDFLKMHPNQKYSTSNISKLLDIPSSTARNYTREIAKDHANFILYHGRPNVIEFQTE